MIIKRLTAVITLILLSLVSISIFYNAWNKGMPFPLFNQYYQITDYVREVENYMIENLPFREEWRQLSVSLEMKGGEREYDNIFIGNDILVENIGYPNEKVTKANTDALLNLVEQSRISTHFMLLPTKCAIKQNEIHRDAPLFNQKQWIEETYYKILGNATAVDVYPVLFSNLDQYLYYRTDPSLTSLGAYYVYEVLTQRLGNEPRPQEKFDIQHVAHDFLGRTYQVSPYKNITPDVISLYRYQEQSRSYTVSHEEDYSYMYNTLFPTQLLEFGQGLNVILGGNTGDITLRSNVRNDSTLLIIGDESILPVIPFLMSHYSQIRFIDLSKWKKQDIPNINCGDYQRMLVTYSVDTFIHKSAPSKMQFLDTSKTIS